MSYIVTIRTQRPRPSDGKPRWEVTHRVEVDSVLLAAREVHRALYAHDGCSVTVTLKRATPKGVSVGSPAVNHA